MPAALVEPLLALAAGVIILITPQIFKYALAAYLIIIGGAGVVRYLGVV